jgi:hypothetical protein
MTSAATILDLYGGIAAAFSKGAVNQDTLAEELLKKAEAIGQMDFRSAGMLGGFYHRRWIRAQTVEQRADFAKKELDQDEMALDQSKADPEYHRALVTAAKAAIEANAIDKATEWATEASISARVSSTRPCLDYGLLCHNAYGGSRLLFKPETAAAAWGRHPGNARNGRGGLQRTSVADTIGAGRCR